ncbi:MAG: Gfo/Idh/MocA family oxidoreductase [Chloroflexi bacterium]|nr:Gfo/Idh/MocA family oxidoreductase [Chloroflexota bacterium]
MESHEGIDLVAGADVNDEVRERFKARYPGARTYDSADKLVADPDIEAVWIATPNRFHAPHTILAAEHGKHVVVEKPMGLNIQQAEQMVAAADKYGVKLLAGHTRSFTLPIRMMRKIITSGKLGKLCAAHIWSYSDWMLRPRTPDELDLSQGGGIPYRQGPHQIDTIRVLGGGKLRSVRGMTGQWMEARPIPGYYSAYLEFEDGTPCTIMHNSYGYFVGAELVPWGESKQHYDVQKRVEIRRSLRTGTRNEAQDKQDMRIGGSMEHVVRDRSDRRAWVPEDMGMLVVSCERGDIRHSKFGLYVYDDEGGIRDIELSEGAMGRRAELDELYNAIVLDKPVFHDGRWGMATLEVCLAIMESARERREIMLTHQIAVPADYDADLDVPI